MRLAICSLRGGVVVRAAPFHFGAHGLIPVLTDQHGPGAPNPKGGIMAKEHWMILGSGAGVGAGLMYLFDPQGGKGRRAVARDKAVSAASKGGDSLRKASKDLGNRS